MTLLKVNIRALIFQTVASATFREAGVGLRKYADCLWMRRSVFFSYVDVIVVVFFILLVAGGGVLVEDPDDVCAELRDELAGDFLVAFEDALSGDPFGVLCERRRRTVAG